MLYTLGAGLMMLWTVLNHEKFSAGLTRARLGPVANPAGGGMQVGRMGALRAFGLAMSLVLLGSLGVANAAEPAAAGEAQLPAATSVTAQSSAATEAAPSAQSASSYAARETSAKTLETFEGGDTTIIIGGSALVLILIIVLIVVLV
jgi:hypothetical protein